MKKGLKYTLVSVLSAAIVGCGAMSIVSGVQWGQAKDNLKIAKENLEEAKEETADSEKERQVIRDQIQEVKNKTFQADESKYKKSFSPSENQASVAAVFCVDPTGYGSLGSSYPIATDLDADVQYFVTNGHVVADYQKDGQKLYVRLENKQNVPAEVVFFEFDAQMDIAILKIEQPTSERRTVIIRNSDEVKTGEKVTAIGYPDKSSEIDPRMSYDMASQTVTGGVISKTDVVPGSVAYHTFQHDAFISHGNSGGPLFDENGYLIGMNTLIHKNSESVNFAIQSKLIMEILDQNNIPYITSEDYLANFDALVESEKEELENEKAEAVKKLEKQLAKIENAEEIAEFEERVEKRKDEVENNKLLMFVFAGAAAVCVIGLLLVLFVRGGGNPDDDGLTSYLVCVKGVFAGMRYDISKHTMTIGRDRNTCTMVFPEDTPGISSNHCSIYFDMRTKTFMLTDNGSTYGTYLGDGRKLTKGVPESLEPGSTFALADKSNEFKVERG